MNIYQPYTYLIKFIPTGQVYYGSSFANNKWKVAHPSQLWTTYFTSSKIIKGLINEYGVDSFEVSIRRCFDSKEKTILWENRILKKFNAAHNPMWFNKSNGSVKFICPHHSAESKKQMSKNKIGVKRKPHSAEARKKMSDARQGKSSWNKGKPMSPETRKKLSEIAKNRPPMSDEVKSKISEANKNKPSPKKGIKLSDEIRAKMSAAKRKGK